MNNVNDTGASETTDPNGQPGHRDNTGETLGAPGDMHTATLSAFFDGEPVDPKALGLALEDPDARAALVDFVRLRQGLTVAPESLPASLHALRRRTPRVAIVRWSAAAALLVLVFLAGWLAPRPPASTSSPPEPARVEKFVPGVDWSFGN